MRSILVVARQHLFPGLSPQGFLPAQAVDVQALAPYLFFAERDYMENCSHYKQLIPYLVLTRGDRVLCYQRRTKHTETRLGGLWSVGFGGHIEPMDRTDSGAETEGLLQLAARRELAEETGLPGDEVELALSGFINSDREDVSSVHFGIVYTVVLDELGLSDDELMDRVSAQAEPHRALWIDRAELSAMLGQGQGPDGGSFEDWSRIAVEGTLT